MQVITARETDLGGIVVRRLLPQRARRLVGPWCFLDLMGPLRFTSGKPMDVPPHPHIGIQTVTWLLEGEALHKDSLGSEAVARPGALNLMTSGRGIAHSEETPVDHSGALHGLQLWVALPDTHRDDAPSFDHYASRPRVSVGDAEAVVILGDFAGAHAEARTFWPMMAAEIALPADGAVVLPLDPAFEHGLVTTTGACASSGVALGVDTLGFLPTGERSVELRAVGGPARMVLLGGAPFLEPIVMWWNFVARTTEEILAAREDWQAGRRFGEVTRYAGDRLMAPAFVGRPVAANPMS